MYEQVTAMGIPVRLGGLKDQPHIWIQEYYVVYQEKTTFDVLERQRLAVLQQQQER